jgi:succinoglycan biosynthesis protein ExoO
MVDATVIIAAWRAEDHLARAVRSALSQESVRLEVIVVDDASPDGTFAAAQECARSDGRVRVLRMADNGGPSAARNAGLAVAQGRWIAVLDADDAMLPARLTRLIALGEQRGADAVYDDFQPVDETACPVGPSHLAPYRLDSAVRWDLETFLAGCQAEPGRPGLGYLKPVLRRSFMQAEGLKYDETLRNGEDFHLMAALLVAGGALWVTPEVGYVYTTRKGSISAQLDPRHARALAIADAALVARHQATIGHRATELMRRRQRRFGDLSTAETILQAVRSGHPVRAVGALVRRPRAAGRLLRQTWEAARRRLA